MGVNRHGTNEPVVSNVKETVTVTLVKMLRKAIL